MSGDTGLWTSGQIGSGEANRGDTVSPSAKRGQDTSQKTGLDVNI